jgi:N-acetyl sugar amidotransferase
MEYLKKLPSEFHSLRIIDPEKQVVYCKKCVLSNQRPHTMFNDEGICAPCLWGKFKQTGIDWEKREKEFTELLDKHRSKNGEWDVIIPASGGKDSGYVAYQLKHKYGMHPLTVTWASALNTTIGRENFEDFVMSGYDNIKGTPNGEINKKLSRITFEEFGDNFLPFIYGQVNFPLQIAAKYKIPLVLWGEDGDVEYGGRFDRWDESEITLEYMINRKMSGHPPEFWKSFGIDINQLQFYMPPKKEELESIQFSGRYLSYYKKWEPEKNVEIAKKHTGYKTNPDGRIEGTYTDFASLDDKTDGFHYYMAFIKFGIGRATADACHQIRDGIISRDEGVDLVHEYDHEFPSKYLDEFLEYMKLDLNSLNKIIDKFRRNIIWEKHDNDWKLRYQVQKL